MTEQELDTIVERVIARLRPLLIDHRDADLRRVDATERLLDMAPRTAQLREQHKRGIIESRTQANGRA